MPEVLRLEGMLAGVTCRQIVDWRAVLAVGSDILESVVAGLSWSSLIMEHKHTRR